MGSDLGVNQLLWPRFSVAPMMAWTDRHCRFFLRGFSPRVLLYTEMVTAAAVLRGDRRRLLAFSPAEQPVALQLGGSEPGELAAAARAGEEAGYREINLNCGCPSDRVSAGAFGACLMREPARVADCVAAMRAVVRVPVTVKTRIGVLDGGPGRREAVQQFDAADYAALHGFVAAVTAAGAAGIIVHARKAVLGGLSPAENRSVPPLRHDVVRRLRADFPALPLALNGGLRLAQHCIDALAWCDSVMIGREAYHRPYLLAELQAALYPGDDWQSPTPAAALERMAAYAAEAIASGERLSSITRHLLGLVTHQTGAREFRRLLSEGARRRDAGPELLAQAARLVVAAA